MSLPTVEITIEAAAVSDIPAIAALLRAAELPCDDVAPHVAHFIVARQGSDVVGAIGAEVHAPDALLRSLVVAAGHRGTGLGGKLVKTLERVADGWGVKRWWLLTTTAQAFFAGRGFTVASRADAPGPIQQTRQFMGACCASAVCLTRSRRQP